MSLWLAILAQSYLFDPHPNEYVEGDSIIISGGPLTSTRRLVKYPYTDSDLFCMPKTISTNKTSMQEIIGDVFYRTAMTIQTKWREQCHFICRKKYTKEQKERLISLIDDHYKINLYADYVPAAVQIAGTKEAPIYLNGFDIGFKEDEDRSHGLIPGKHYIVSHLDISITLAEDQSLGMNTVTRFDVTPVSLPDDPPCPFAFPDALEDTDEIVYTYSVYFETVEAEDNHRFREVLAVHYGVEISSNGIWCSILAVLALMTIVIVLFIFIVIPFMKSKGDSDSPFILIRRDVFRPPKRRKMLAFLVSSGIHILLATCLVVIMMIFRCFSPGLSGSLFKTWLTWYVILTPVAGYVCIYFLVFMGILKWQKAVLFSACGECSLILLVPLVRHVVAVVCHASFRLSLATVLIILIVCALSVILHFGTAVIIVITKGFTSPKNFRPIPRKIPPKPIFLNSELLVMVGGGLTYFVIRPMINSLLNAMWSRYVVYKLFMPFATTFVLMVSTTVLFTMIAIILTLYREDYEWWWVSFRIGYQSASFVFLHLVYHWMRFMNTKDVATAVIFFAEGIACSLLVGVANGAVGFISTLLMMRKIYKGINLGA